MAGTLDSGTQSSYLTGTQPAVCLTGFVYIMYVHMYVHIYE